MAVPALNGEGQNREGAKDAKGRKVLLAKTGAQGASSDA
jgi:hypothetical protein